MKKVMKILLAIKPHGQFEVWRFFVWFNLQFSLEREIWEISWFRSRDDIATVISSTLADTCAAMCVLEFAFQFNPLPHSAIPSRANRGMPRMITQNQVENAPKRNELRENEKKIGINCKTRGSRQEVPQMRAAHDTHVVYVRNTRILDTYVYSTARVYNIYIFLYYIFRMCIYVCMCVCVRVCVCIMEAPKDTRTRFSKLLRLRRMRENETYISDSRRGKDFNLLSSFIERRVHFRIFENLPGNFFFFFFFLQLTRQRVEPK